MKLEPDLDPELEKFSEHAVRLFHCKKGGLESLDYPLLKIKLNSIIRPLNDRVLALSAGGPGFNPQSRTASYQRRYKNGTSSSLVWHSTLKREILALSEE